MTALPKIGTDAAPVSRNRKFEEMSGHRRLKTGEV
jgi:hypothetical protein